MNYVEQLKQRYQETGNIVCVGMDPVIEKIPLTTAKTEPAKAIERFYTDMIYAFTAENTIPACVKPNIAFFEQYDVEGIIALKNIIKRCKEAKIPILLDAKRGDIGKTSKAYAKAIFDVLKVDAVTVAPYMGSDSVNPFIEYCEKGKGVYVLVRTSNKGAVDLQDLKVEGIPIYMKTAEKLVEWHKPGVCAVIGATYPAELKEINTFFANSGKEIPILLPGVGAQGGSAEEVIKILKNTTKDGNIGIYRINSSSGINYAYQKYDTDDYAGAAVKALKELIKTIHR